MSTDANVRLRPLSQSEFDTWSSIIITDYANDKVMSGNWPAEGALERSQAEFAKLLPEGVETTNHYLFAIVTDHPPEHVGVAWLALTDFAGSAAFLYDFVIFEPFRRRGYALEALSCLEDEARKLGRNGIALHVFGHNRAARALYEKAGFEITNINMIRRF
ncbi:MAG: GNAT family N-acetyltransferase [Caldilineales bacterium]|nr:GNAT family N-acetyltransferase [Caldilineales bacterium]